VRALSTLAYGQTHSHTGCSDKCKWAYAKAPYSQYLCATTFILMCGREKISKTNTASAFLTLSIRFLPVVFPAQHSICDLAPRVLPYVVQAGRVVELQIRGAPTDSTPGSSLQQGISCCLMRFSVATCLPGAMHWTATLVGQASTDKAGQASHLYPLNNDGKRRILNSRFRRTFVINFVVIR
jgi:hypothetical protein